ncbi:MAG: hypothetical protein QXJ42_05220 [Desulfurococcaceae archaeon]
MEKNIVNSIFRNKKVIISHYLNPKLKLIVYVLNNIDGKIIVFDENNYLNKTGLIENIHRDVIISNNIQINPPVDYGLIYIEPSFIPRRLRNRNVLVTITPIGFKTRIPRFYSRIYLNKVSENIYQINLLETNEKYRFRIIDNSIEFIDKPEGVYGKVYSIIRNNILEYGELSIKDAVNIVSKELGVSKEYARKLISKLVVEKYIRVEKGFLSIY